MNKFPSLDELAAEWNSRLTPTPTTQLLINALYANALNTNAQGVNTMLTCLIRLEHLGKCKLPAEIAQAVAAFRQ